MQAGATPGVRARCRRDWSRPPAPLHAARLRVHARTPAAPPAGDLPATSGGCRAAPVPYSKTADWEMSRPSARFAGVARLRLVQPGHRGTRLTHDGAAAAPTAPPMRCSRRLGGTLLPPPAGILPPPSQLPT